MDPGNKASAIDSEGPSIASRNNVLVEETPEEEEHGAGAAALTAAAAAVVVAAARNEFHTSTHHEGRIWDPSVLQGRGGSPSDDDVGVDDNREEEDGHEDEDEDEHGAAHYPPEAAVVAAATTGDPDLSAAVAPAGAAVATTRKRYCRFPGCTKVVKSQGHCQKHGARAKRCRVPGCDKQAQGTHDGMCKRHWKEVHFPDPALMVAAAPTMLLVPPSHPGGGAAQLPGAASLNGHLPEGGSDDTAAGEPAAASHHYSLPGADLGHRTGASPFGLTSRQLATPIGESVYDSIIPQSVGYRPGLLPLAKPTPSAVVKPPGDNAGGADGIDSAVAANSDSDAGGPKGVASSSSQSFASMMPLVAFLRRGRSREVGWHRQQERLARGLLPVSSLGTQLESWERQLALVEILLLSGGTPNAVFRDLAHAWGREKNFHLVLVNTVCARRGEVERKKRSTSGIRTGKRKPRQQLSEGEEAPASASASASSSSHSKRHKESPELPPRGNVCGTSAREGDEPKESDSTGEEVFKDAHQLPPEQEHDEHEAPPREGNLDTTSPSASTRGPALADQGDDHIRPSVLHAAVL